MITLLLWICPFTWPFAIMRMRRKREQRMLAAINAAIARGGQPAPMWPPAPAPRVDGDGQ